MLKEMLDEIRQADPYGIAWDLDVDSDPEDGTGIPWERLAADCAARQAALRDYEQAHGVSLPPSFHRFVADLGYPDLTRSLLGPATTGLWLQWVAEPIRTQDPGLLEIAEEELCDPDGKPPAGFYFVDNPGDAPGHCYVCLFDCPVGEGEYLWCYAGYDHAFDGGVFLAPVATAFGDLAEAVALGLTDLLLLEPGAAEERQQKLAAVRKRHPGRYRDAIAHLRAALEQGCSLELEIPDVDEDEGDPTLAGGIKAVRERLAGYGADQEV